MAQGSRQRLASQIGLIFWKMDNDQMAAWLETGDADSSPPDQPRVLHPVVLKLVEEIINNGGEVKFPEAVTSC